MAVRLHPSARLRKWKSGTSDAFLAILGQTVSAFPAMPAIVNSSVDNVLWYVSILQDAGSSPAVSLRPSLGVFIYFEGPRIEAAPGAARLWRQCGHLDLRLVRSSGCSPSARRPGPLGSGQRKPPDLIGASRCAPRPSRSSPRQRWGSCCGASRLRTPTTRRPSILRNADSSRPARLPSQRPLPLTPGTPRHPSAPARHLRLMSRSTCFCAWCAAARTGTTTLPPCSTSSTWGTTWKSRCCLRGRQTTSSAAACRACPQTPQT